MTKERPPQGLRFRMTERSSWNGNGFGTDSAHWVAEHDGQEVGTWFRPASGFVQVTVMGRRSLSSTGYRDWRKLVADAVQKAGER